MSKTEKIVLGIETSCDDTSICLLKGNLGIHSKKPEVLALNLFNQETLLKKWGGVVPEIAARNHLAKLAPLLEQTFAEAKLHPSQIDIIGVTTHPGLLGPLLTGLNSAKTLSLIHQTPIVPINHLYAHIEAIHLVEEVHYPYLGLIVSGGHTLFVLAHSPVKFEILGTTIDDAAGEAFDKGGKLMGLDYPAGKKIDDLAQQGNQNKYPFPIGLKSSANADLSFSGVKTSLRVWTEQNGLPQVNEQTMKDLCASYQEAIVQALKLKTRYAFKAAQEKTGKAVKLVIGGGVACNSRLRKVFNDSYRETLFVPPQFCTDNAGMIANYALRIFTEKAVFFPDTLRLDAHGRFIDKNALQSRAQGKQGRKT